MGNNYPSNKPVQSEHSLKGKTNINLNQNNSGGRIENNTEIKF